MAKFTACNTCTQVVAADAYSIILDRIREVVVSFGHGSDEDTDTFVFVQTLDVVAHAHNLRVEAKCDLSAVGREVVRNWVFDYLNELLLRRGRSDLMSMK